jgi:signal transduction histidine kinase
MNPHNMEHQTHKRRAKGPSQDATGRTQETPGTAEEPISPTERPWSLAVETDRSAPGILVLACIWLVFLIYPIAGLLQAALQPALLALALAGALVFFGIYFWTIWRIACGANANPPWRALLILGAIGLALPLLAGGNWLGFFVYTGLIAGLTLRLKQVIAAILLMVGLTILSATVTRAPWWETVALTSVTIFGSCMAFGMSWLRAINQELRAARAQFATMAASEERLRLARELHDSVKQQVFVTSMELGAARALLDHDRQSAETHLHEAETVIRQVHTDLDALIHELRPVPFEVQGLAKAIQAHTAVWSRRTHIAATVRVHGEQTTSLVTERALFRVVQEALTNIEKHSAATQVQMTLTWRDQLLRVQICDNGRGFIPAEAGGQGYGLLHMHERMEALGGALTIESTPGSGTRITCTCPLHPSGKGKHDA